MLLSIFLALFTVNQTATANINNNLLKNPSFETGNTSGWKGKATISSKNVRSGRKALSLSGNPSILSKIQQTISVKPGKKYRLSAWLKVTGISRGNYGFRISWYNASKKEITTARQVFGETKKKTSYINHARNLIAPPKAVTMSLFLISNKANGIGYYDNISITNTATAKTQTAKKEVSPSSTFLANSDLLHTELNRTKKLNLTTNDKGFAKNTKITLKSKPTNGRVVLKNNGLAIYTPNKGYHGNDSFIYQLKNANGDISIADVSITVECTKNCKKSFKLNWHASVSPSVIGYKIHVGHNAKKFDQVIRVKKINNFIYQAKDKGKYYFAVSAINRSGAESGYSAVASTTF